ncbi:MAG: MAPEG family protein, partial [Arenimonas sp.]
FPLFAVAVIVAQLNGADQARVDLLALSFIGLRILYGILYMANKASLRSLVWLAAMVCVVMIFVAGK